MPNDQVSAAETALILSFAEKCLSLDGDFVELGCYRGDTSVLLGKLLSQNRGESCGKLSKTCGQPVENSQQNVENLSNSVDKMCKTSLNLCKNPANLCKTGGKLLWIYDSFEGLPEKTRADSSGAGANFQKGELFVSKREVIEKLRKNGLKTASHPNNPAENPDSQPDVIVKKAWFSDLKPEDLPEKIAFAFLDGDLYDSLKVSLKLVVPRLVSGGIIIAHDYNNPHLPGAAKAVDEFLRANPAFRLEIRQTLAILTRPQSI